MTNQVAITMLKNIEQSLDDYCELNDEGKEAFHMAITALELFGNSEQLPSTHSKLEKNSQKLDNENGELISWRAAIDAIGKKQGGVFEQDTEIDTAILYVYSECKAIIKDLPSVQPERMVLPEICILEGYDTMEDENGNKGFGVYIPSKKQIYVAGDVPQEIMLKALFHELAHWVQDISGRHFDEDEANLLAERAYEALPHDMRGDSDDR